MGNNCTAIAGAISQSYQALAADVNHALRVQVSATNAGGSSGPATSNATAAVIPEAPANTALPTISGTAQQGQTLTAGNGSWTNEPTSYAYQWLRCDASGASCLPIAAATTQTYIVASADVGSTLRVAVTASNAGGSSAPASSQQTEVVPCSAAQSAYSGVISSTAGLMGYWRLGESSGTTACDSTTQQNNGTYSGGFTLGAPGALQADPATAVSFDGLSGQMSVPAASSLNVGDTFSIEAWVERGRSGTGSNEVIASKQNNAWVLMFNESDRLALRQSTVGEVATANVATTDTGNWHYAVATKNGSSVHLYLDGVDVTGSVANHTMANSSQPLVVGQSTGTAYLKGSVEEVALYKTALSAAQVAEHYSAGINSQHDPVLATVGDVACPTGDTVDACQQSATANLTASLHPSAVAVLGDNQYESGLLSEFNGAGAYNDTWGQFNAIVHPAPGNHEYAASSSASGYFTYFGSSAGSGNYSYDLGSWHVISLNSDCIDSGCEDSLAGSASSAEVIWLQGDLAAHPNQCILAYWHHPRFSSGWVGNSPGVAPFWNALYAAHADVVLNGHEHMYERFAQQDPAQHATSEGLREFVVGTGGESLFTMGTIQPNMQVVDNGHFGVLFLTLHAHGYEWSFRATSGTVLDSGATPCHAQTGSKSALTLKTQSPSVNSPVAAPSPAVESAQKLTADAAPDRARLAFAVRPVRAPTSNAPARGAPVVEVRCSRACDVSVRARVRRGHSLITLTRYRETEAQLTKPVDRTRLRLSRWLLRRLGGSRLVVTFVAVDASNERRTITRTLTLPPR